MPQKIVDRQKILDDIKIFFDSVKNFGVCLSLVYSLKYLQDFTIALGMPSASRAVVNLIALFSLMLMFFACYYWLRHSLNATLSSTWFNKIGLLIVLCLAALVLGYIITMRLPSIPLNPFSIR